MRGEIIQSMALVLASIVALGGCGKPMFTQAVRESHSLSPADLQHIQFYTSDEIVLRRDLTEQAQEKVGDALVVSEGVVFDEVVIPKHTPGVALRVEGDFLLIGFSRDDPERSLWFGIKRGNNEFDVPLADTPYTLMHLANRYDEEGFEPRYAKGYLFTYEGKQYQVANPKMRDVYLVYDDGDFANKRERRAPPGWRLTDAPSSGVRATITVKSKAE